MALDYAFTPAYGSTKTLTSTASSASVQMPAGTKNIRVANTGANIAYFRIGNGAQTATAADCFILPNTIEIFTKDHDATTFAHISPAGATLVIVLGEGL
jgi:hypothetical protein